MTRSPRVWPYALAVSLLLHAVLVVVLVGRPSAVEVPSDSLPIEARLIQLAQPAAPAPPARPRPRTAPRPVAETPRAEQVAEPQASESETAVAEAAEAGEAAGPGSEEGVAVESPEAPVVAEAVPLNALPPRIDMRFHVRYGIARGEQTLVWVSDGERYTVTSVAAATGIAGIFYGGRFVQTSQGRITARGLVPEMFWDQRGERRSFARFDLASGTLTYQPEQGPPRQFPLSEGTQDTLSLFFQLALTGPLEGASEFAVFNGRKLRQYAYALVGETVLETALGPLRTLHLARRGNADGRFEVWLAIDRYYLPVRVLRSDDKGNEVELLVASITP
ncbi:MAG: DUF3108 domain-containing protein [Thiobacillus sp.]